jgi:release factor glutamine methyltransferase
MNESDTTRPLTVKRALTHETARLRAASATPRLDVEILLAHVLGTTRERLYAVPERELTADERARLRELVGRRARSEPVAYLTGHKAFRDIDLQVNAATLIPRPETETLVEVVLAKLRQLEGAPAAAAGLHARRPLKVLDVGTGSGAVALAIAHEHPTVRVVATDVQFRALEMARLNAARLGLSDRVEFLASDLFDDLPMGALFDVIVSNPPYVADGDLAATPPDVHRFEPHEALLGGAAGMDFYQRLVPAAPPFLRPEGWLALEIAADKASEVRAVFEECGRFESIEVHHDLGGSPRVIAGRERS